MVKNKMKIAEFSNSFIPVYDGVGRVTKAYCETLSQMGQQVYAVVPKDPGLIPLESMQYKVLAFPSISVSRKFPYRVGFPTLDFVYKSQLKKIPETPFDICHAHDPGPVGKLALWYARKYDLPLVGTFHSKYYDDVYKMTKSKTIAKIAARVVAGFYEHCDDVWTVSNNSAETLRSYGYQGNIQVMPNGTDLRTLDTSVLPKIVEQYHLGSDPILLFVGQMNWKKNIMRVLEACVLLRNQGQNFQLVLAGRGPNEKDIAREVEKLGLSSLTVMTGHITNPAELDGLYYLSTLFLFPSIYDNAPMVLREAANMGTPGIVVKGSSTAEVVVNEENGMLCEDTSESLFLTVKKALADRKLLDRMSTCAKQTIPRPWQGDIMESVLARYQYLVAKHKSNR